MFLLIWTILKDFKEYSSTHQLTSYLTTSIGLFFLAIILPLYFYKTNITNSPTLLKAFYNDGIKGFSIDLKENGYYSWASSTKEGRTHTYGTYTIADSIITLDKSNIDNTVKTNKLLVKNILFIFPSDTIGNTDTTYYIKYILQIDKKGMELDTGFRFRVIVDNRKENESKTEKLR